MESVTQKRARQAVVAVAVAVAAFSALVGAAPNVVEDNKGIAVECGAALWHRGPRPSPLCDTTFDLWRAAAQTGLVVAAVLSLVAVTPGLRVPVMESLRRRHNRVLGFPRQGRKKMARRLP